MTQMTRTLRPLTLIAALAFAFATSLGEFGASLLISRPEFPTVPVVIARLLSQPGAPLENPPWPAKPAEPSPSR